MDERNGNDKYFCEDICEKCYHNRFGCRVELNDRVNTGYNDKGEGIIVVCSGFQQDED